MAIPIIFANCATPLLGLTDIAVIGHFGSVNDVAAIALCALLLNLIFWSFGFLRMSTSGFVAQARGRRDALAELVTIARAVLLALAIGVALIALQWLLAQFAFALFDADAVTEKIAREFFYVRIWSAPATLALYVFIGFFIGCGAGRSLLTAQFILNGTNIALDIFFAGVLQWGARGIAIGTALAEWITVFIVGVMVWRRLRKHSIDRAALQSALRDVKALRTLLSANGDILLRTFSLLAGFAIFTERGAHFGADTLAGNHVLFQLVSFSAILLDSFAYIAEARTGRAFGARDRAAFFSAVRRTTHLAAGTALLLALLLWIGGDFFIAQLTALPSVRAVAHGVLPFGVAYVFFSFAAFQLDGIFIGTTQTRALRNAALVSTSLFALLAFSGAHYFGNKGLWMALVGFVVLRALSLAAYYPRAFAALR